MRQFKKETHQERLQQILNDNENMIVSQKDVQLMLNVSINLRESHRKA